ncbi:MAG: hypothetical protein HY862_09340 [Chloroflexi bacterium]|nr:hypothetical protein [Chloroflexota bacterium]
MGDPYRGRRTTRPPKSTPPAQRPYRDPVRDEPQEDYDDDRYAADNQAPQRSKTGGFSFNWQDILFVGLLVLAAARGAKNRGGDGCLPGKGCMRVVALVITSLALIGGAIYLSSIDQNTFSNQFIGGMACVGTILCFASAGTLFLVLFGVLRLINLDMTPDKAMHEAGGLLGGGGGILNEVLGGLFGNTHKR